VLSEKRIPFEVTEIDLKHKPDWFLQISPYGKVPVLQHGEEILYESSIINEYLDEVFPDVSMLAAEPAARAHERIWIDFCNTRLQPGLAAVMRAEPEDFDARVQAFEEALTRLEEHLERADMPAPFFGGERFGLVDATFAPAFERFAVLPRLRGYEVPGRFARVRRWMAALAAHPSVVATATPLEALLANYRGFLPERLRAQVA